MFLWLREFNVGIAMSVYAVQSTEIILHRLLQTASITSILCPASDRIKWSPSIFLFYSEMHRKIEVSINIKANIIT